MNAGHLASLLALGSLGPFVLSHCPSAFPNNSWEMTLLISCPWPYFILGWVFLEQVPGTQLTLNKCILNEQSLSLKTFVYPSTVELYSSLVCPEPEQALCTRVICLAVLQRLQITVIHTRQKLILHIAIWKEVVRSWQAAPLSQLVQDPGSFYLVSPPSPGAGFIFMIQSGFSLCPCSKEQGGDREGKGIPFSFRITPKCCTHHFYSHPIVNLVTRPHLTAREAGKDSHYSGLPYIQLKILFCGRRRE